MALPGGVGQLGTDGHITELGVQHLFLGVREAVLLLRRLIAHEDIDEDQTHDEGDQGILLSDLLAAEFVAVEPGLYVVCRWHITSL